MFLTEFVHDRLGDGGGSTSEIGCPWRSRRRRCTPTVDRPAKRLSWSSSLSGSPQIVIVQECHPRAARLGDTAIARTLTPCERSWRTTRIRSPRLCSMRGVSSVDPSSTTTVSKSTLRCHKTLRKESSSSLLLLRVGIMTETSVTLGPLSQPRPYVPCALSPRENEPHSALPLCSRRVVEDGLEFPQPCRCHCRPAIGENPRLLLL